MECLGLTTVKVAPPADLLVDFLVELHVDWSADPLVDLCVDPNVDLGAELAGMQFQLKICVVV